MIYSILLVVALLLCWQGYEFWVAVGRQPRGERLERCKQSPQWRDGEFVNVHETPTLTGDEGFFGQMYKFLFGKVKNLSHDSNVPTAKSSLKDIPRSEEVCVWLGHSTVYLQTGGVSTVYLQTGGVRFLFDPVLTNRLPVWWFMRPFKGADVYTVNDIPEVDYLIITHDHWDHLDWKTVMALKDRAGQVVILGLRPTADSRPRLAGQHCHQRFHHPPLSAYPPFLWPHGTAQDALGFVPH